jgi:hypothetical protein
MLNMMQSCARTLLSNVHPRLANLAANVQEIAMYLDNRTKELSGMICPGGLDSAHISMDPGNLMTFHNDVTWCAALERDRDSLSALKPEFQQFLSSFNEVSSQLDSGIAATIYDMNEEYSNIETDLIQEQCAFNATLRKVYDDVVAMKPYNPMFDQTQVLSRLDAISTRAKRCLEDDRAFRDVVIELAQYAFSGQTQVFQERQATLLAILPLRKTEPETFKVSFDALRKAWQ